MLKAKDIMTTDVVAVDPQNSIREVADHLVTRGISAVPVVEEGRLVGVISEGDLLRRVEIGTSERHRPWWRRLFTNNATLAAEYTKSHAARVADVMTTEVLTVSEETPLADIAAIFEARKIKRLPVLRDGKVVGIVSRADLVHAIAAAPDTRPQAAPADDESIRAQIIEALDAEKWPSVGLAQVSVTDGIVVFWGMYSSDEERDALRVLASNVPGVRRVDDRREHIAIAYAAV